MLHRALRGSICFVVAAILTSTGCGRSQGPNGHLSGVVTYDSAPVTEGTVLLIPEGAGAGIEAKISTDGNYSTRSQTQGVAPGRYIVTVLPPIIRTADTPTSPGGEEPKVVDNIPKKYRSSKTSELVVEVKNGNNTFDIKMEKAVPAKK